MTDLPLVPPLAAPSLQQCLDLPTTGPQTAKALCRSALSAAKSFTADEPIPEDLLADLRTVLAYEPAGWLMRRQAARQLRRLLPADQN